jgi:hypothetical protein
MNITIALHALFADLKLQTALVVIAVDFILGVLAAVKLNTFRLSYMADFAKNDVLEKLVPWGVLYIASKFAGHQQLLIPGLNLGTAAMAIYVVIIGAWTGSIASSLAQLGLPSPAGRKPLRQFIFGPENSGPDAVVVNPVAHTHK